MYWSDIHQYLIINNEEIEIRFLLWGGESEYNIAYE